MKIENFWIQIIYHLFNKTISIHQYNDYYEYDQYHLSILIKKNKLNYYNSCRHNFPLSSTDEYILPNNSTNQSISSSSTLSDLIWLLKISWNSYKSRDSDRIIRISKLTQLLRIRQNLILKNLIDKKLNHYNTIFRRTA